MTSSSWGTCLRGSTSRDSVKPQITTIQNNRFVRVPYSATSVLIGPHLAFHGVHQAGHRQQEEDDANAGALAVLHFRLRRPGEELNDIGGFLVEGRLGAVGIGHLVVAEWRRHADLVAGEILVVVVVLGDAELLDLLGR